MLTAFAIAFAQAARVDLLLKLQMTSDETDVHTEPGPFATSSIGAKQAMLVPGCISKVASCTPVTINIMCFVRL